MLRILASLVLAMTLVASPVVADEHSPWAPTWSWSTEVWSKYVAGPNGAVSYDKPVLQSSITATWSNCLFVSIWSSKALGSGSARGNGGNEVDWTIGCAKTFDNGVGVMVSFNYYDLSAPTLFSSRGDLVQAVFEVSYTWKAGVHTIVPYLRAEPSWVVGGIARDGIYYHVGVRHAWVLNSYLSLVDSFRLVYDPSGIYGLDPGWNARIDASLSWKLTDKLSLHAPMTRAFFPLSSFRDGRKNEFVLGIGMSGSF